MAGNSAKTPDGSGNARPGKARRFRRLVQAASLMLFLWLLWRQAASPQGANGPIPPDFFPRLDPLAATATLLAGREWIAALLPGLSLLAVALLAGRLFCGWICPFGATLDAASGLMRRHAGPVRECLRPSPSARKIKYLLLIAVLAAALAGVNLAWWAAPIPLITRFYGLLLHPLALLGGHEILALSRPALNYLDWPALNYLAITPRRFASLYFLAGFFGLIFWLERVKPRFWCRFICPAGALLGLFSLFPIWRRRVSSCIQCGKCARTCPAGALPPQGRPCPHSECITCQTCADVCPTRGTAFSFFRPSNTADDKKSPATAPLPTAPGPSALPSRRAFLAAAAGGVGLAGLERSALGSLLGPDARGNLWSKGCLRPPGALPEAAFLDRCLRCGLCMRACPSNGLQPAWLAAGPEGMFSPVLTPRRGPCEPDCNLCGQVCPTQAITPLPLTEKRWAKIGGAVVHNNRCLAWAEDKRCVVCQEVCPFGAVECVQTAGALVPVPLVKAAKCFGCGYCEQHCPARVPAITVQPLNALRLARGSYIQAGKAAGLSLEPIPRKDLEQTPTLPAGSLPPGFSE